MAPRSSAGPRPAEAVDTSELEGLIGYNVRRASLTFIDCFMTQMVAHSLRPVEFSILLLLRHNPGVTSSQLCSLLNIRSSNLVGLVNQLEARGLSRRKPHPNDGRALGLHLTPAGRTLIEQAKVAATRADRQVTERLTDAQRDTLVGLLQLIYR